MSRRENKALKALLKGDSVEKRVMVGYEGDKQGGGDKIDRLSDIMKDARMPVFCPKCEKVMKIKLDNKMWLLLFEFYWLFGELGPPSPAPPRRRRPRPRRRGSASRRRARVRGRIRPGSRP